MGLDRWGAAGNDFNGLVNGREKLPGIRPPGGGLRQQSLQCGGPLFTGPFSGRDIPGSLLAVCIGSRVLPDGGNALLKLLLAGSEQAPAEGLQFFFARRFTPSAVFSV